MTTPRRPDKRAPTVRLAFGNRAQEQHAVATDHLPALLVSFPYLRAFLKNRHRYRYRNWVLDSGAFTFANSGKSIDLANYIATCKKLQASDPSLVEVFALDVIGDPVRSAKNAEAMWKVGIRAIPTFHYGEPESALLSLAATYPKIAIGGVAYKRGGAKIKWAEQVFSRVWPKRIHGFAYGGEKALMALPFHSVDASTWEIAPCGFGEWHRFGQMTVRGSVQDLRSEVLWFLDLEERARVRWAKQMRELEVADPAPSVRLAVVSTLGRGELTVT